MSEGTEEGQDGTGSWSRRLLRFYEHRVTRVFVVVATVVALPWGTWDVWTYFANRRAIDSACAGMVPVGKVTDLPLSGGRISHNSDSISLDKVSGRCMLYSTGAGEAKDSSSGEWLFFRGSVSTEPGGSPASPLERSASWSTRSPPICTVRSAAASPGK